MPDPRDIRSLPDALLRQDAFPADRRPRLVVTGFGGTVRSSFSGSSAFLAEAGIEEGSLDGAVTLFGNAEPDRVLQAKGALWKARQRVRRESARGFKFSPEFSDHLWGKHLDALAGTDLINNSQLFADSVYARRAERSVRAFFYLDGTLHDYLRGYRDYDVAAIDPAMVDRAEVVERRGYEQADGIAVMSDFVADTLVDRYGIPRERVAVVLPGANMTDAMAAAAAAVRAERAPRDEVVVGFVGVYPARKGLPKLADAISLLRGRGVPVRLQVVGRCPEDLAARDGVDALGVIDKQKDPDGFARAMAQVDLGCQLSTVELSGIAALEYLRCGIPVLLTDVGGAADHLRTGGGILLPGDVSVEEVAAAIQRFVESEDERRRLEAEAAGLADSVRWQHTATRLGEFIAAAR